MLNLLPWRVRNYCSEHLPLLYHLVANLGASANDSSHWDQRLAETWSGRTWPTKNQKIMERTAVQDRILDIACGNGSVLRVLKEAGYCNLSGLEISSYAVNRLRNEGIHMYQGVVPRLPVPSHTFDIVIASQILEHVIRRGVFMKEILRCLRPGGRAFIFVPNDCLGPIDEPEHVRKYTAATLRSFLSKYFEVLSIEEMKDVNYEMSILFADVRKT